MMEKMGTVAYFAFDMLGTSEALYPKLMKVKKSIYVAVKMFLGSRSHLPTKSSISMMNTTLINSALPAFPSP